MDSSLKIVDGKHIVDDDSHWDPLRPVYRIKYTGLLRDAVIAIPIVDPRIILTIFSWLFLASSMIFRLNQPGL